MILSKNHWTLTYPSFGAFLLAAISYILYFASSKCFVYRAFCIKAIIGTIIVPIDLTLYKKAIQFHSDNVLQENCQNTARINCCNMSTNAISLSRMASWTPSKNEICFSLSISSFWSIVVFFHILQGNVLTNMTSAFEFFVESTCLWFGTLSISRIHLLHINVFPLSSFLASPDTCLQVAFNHATFYADLIISFIVCDIV